MIRSVLLIIMLAGLGISADAASPGTLLPVTLLEEATNTYRSAQSLEERGARLAEFKRAAQLFAAAARHGANAELLTNLGTAHLQAAELGPAILAFRRALLADPDNERAAKNLLQARAVLPEWVPMPEESGALDSFFFFHDKLSPSTRAIVAAALAVTGALLLALGIGWNLRGAYWLAGLTLTLWLAFAVSLAVSHFSQDKREGVLTTEETWARASDSANAPTRFPSPLPGGSEVELIETRDRWARIRLFNGRDAWVPRASLTLLRESEATQE